MAIIGTEVKYFIVQKEKSTEVERLISYQAYNGSFTSSDMIEGATPFEEKQQAIDLAIIQNQIGVILKHGFEYSVIEQTVNRVNVELTPEL